MNFYLNKNQNFFILIKEIKDYEIVKKPIGGEGLGLSKKEKMLLYESTELFKRRIFASLPGDFGKK
jgi:hypothetical protein